jgi:prevent-host-death family protein
MQISVTEAKGKLTDLIRRAEAGDEVILTRHGQAAVRLVPVRSVADRKARRKLLEAIRVSGRAKVTPGPNAAGSQDMLYREDGSPERSPSTRRLTAIVLGEAEAEACIEALEAEMEVLVSTAITAEALIFAGQRNVAEEMVGLIDGLGMNVMAVNRAFAGPVAEVYAQWARACIRPA